MKSVTRFIAERLRLTVNQAKSAVTRPGQRKFLGFSFTGEREPRRRIAQDHRLLQDADSGTEAPNPRHQPAQDGCRTATYLRGWLGYFGECQPPSVLKSLESWLRRRLRSVL